MGPSSCSRSISRSPRPSGVLRYIARIFLFPKQLTLLTRPLSHAVSSPLLHRRKSIQGSSILIADSFSTSLCVCLSPGQILQSPFTSSRLRSFAGLVLWRAFEVYVQKSEVIALFLLKQALDSVITSDRVSLLYAAHSRCLLLFGAWTANWVSIQVMRFFGP